MMGVEVERIKTAVVHRHIETEETSMTIIFGTMSSKGGAGKSTIAKLIAGEYAIKDNSRVLLVDSDPSQNVQAWWIQCGEKGQQPENIDFVSALQTKALDDLMLRKADYGAIIIDTAGRDSVILKNILDYVDVVLTPVQAAKREIDAMSKAIEIVDAYNESHSKAVKHFIIRTRVTAINQRSSEYRFIRQYVEEINKHGYRSRLLDAELLERNIYREIENGYGTVQMQQLTDPVKKARIEVMRLMAEIERHLAGEALEAA